MKSIIYTFLGKYPQHIPVIAQWHQNEWQHISPHLNTQLRVDAYSSYPAKPAIPSCILAVTDDKPAGSASIVLSDMETHPHLSPWLASVYVHPDYRNQGIATELINHCLINAKKLGFQTLYLFTPDQAEFYQKRGWQRLEHFIYHNEHVDIMSFDLTDYPGS